MRDLRVQTGNARNAGILPGISDVYVFVGHNRDVATDVEGNQHRNEWIKITDLEIGPEESIKKIAYRGQSADGMEWGSNNVVLRMDDMNRYVASMMIFCEAMITNERQQEAWKKILRDNFWDWYNDIFYRYNLDLATDEEIGASVDTRYTHVDEPKEIN